MSEEQKKPEEAAVAAQPAACLQDHGASPFLPEASGGVPPRGIIPWFPRPHNRDFPGKRRRPAVLTPPGNACIMMPEAPPPRGAQETGGERHDH